MTLQDAQTTVDNWIKTVGVRYFGELTNMAMLTEEVGEVARIIARRYGEQSEKNQTKTRTSATKGPTCSGCSSASPTKPAWT